MTANSVSSVVPAVQCTRLGVPLSRVVTRYMGPGINSKKMGWDQGSQHRDLGSEAIGSESALL